MHLKWLGQWVLPYLFLHCLGRFHHIVWVLEKWNLVLRLFYLELIASNAVHIKVVKYSCGSFTGPLLTHCEPGAAVVDLQLVDVVVSHVLKQILSRHRCHSMVLMIVAGKAVPNLQLEHGLAVNRVYTGFAIFCCLFTLLKRCFI
ncbi:uncharacterized protein LOC123220650 [Mangifera indica]|uniref:uncharacterized protein LOC123220650 n=1 Tax=Mangifera indica TaxID=29780 RepID=UPI001CFA337C|nr:uncharacterized protein LOC123220650 [Mangifera indica]